MRRITVIVLFALLGNYVYAQKVAVKKVELAGEKIIVYYDLEDSNPNNEYQIFLYSSQNNYTTALTHVKGDVGNEIKPGSKKIEWSIREELGPYKGKIALEVRGKAYAPFAKLQSFDVSRKYKRGKSYPVSWKTGSANPIHIELFKGSERITGELNHPNNGSYQLSIPAKAKSGGDYRIKLTDSRNSEEVIYSGYFKVTPKIPLLLKVAPIAAVGGAVLLFTDPKPPVNTGIPDPPKPGTN